MPRLPLFRRGYVAVLSLFCYSRRFRRFLCCRFKSRFNFLRYKPLSFSRAFFW
jgi:hypothetical protein